MLTKSLVFEPSGGYIVPVRKDYITFIMLGQEVNLISNESVYGLSTVAEINNQYHYLGSEPDTIGSAICAWQDINNREFTAQELRQVMIDNHILGDSNEC
jgi:hypothetical protein